MRCSVNKVFSRLGTVKPPKSVSQRVRAAFLSGIVVNPERYITVFSGVASLFFGFTVPQGAIGATPRKRTGTHMRPIMEGKRFFNFCRVSLKSGKVRANKSGKVLLIWNGLERG